MVKKITTLRIEPDVMEALKRLARKHGKPLGDVIEGLVKFTDSHRYVTDETYVTRFNAILDTCLLNAGNRGGWVIPEDGESADEFVKRKHIEDLEEKKRELEEELRQLNK